MHAVTLSLFLNKWLSFIMTVYIAEVRHDYDNAEKYYNQALNTDPNHANSLYNYAVLMDR